MNDPILDELRRHREQIAAKFGYDPRKLMQDARQRQFESGHDVVSLVSGRKVVVFKSPQSQGSKPKS